ncbi:hypothetical protein [Streptomyces scabiei]|uniref:hypothetical protein n=1 Tax=Streptomyces scabiei TaxID=1930 RepID=UPI000AB53B81
MVVAPGTVLVSFLVGVVVTMLAAYLPARRAAAVPPVAAMSALHTPPPVRNLRRRNVIGVALIVIGVLGVGLRTRAAVGLVPPPPRVPPGAFPPSAPGLPARALRGCRGPPP